MPASCSVQLLSRSISRRCLALILKWNWHLGQTKRFSSRSLRKVMVRQFSHLVHRPSVRTRRSSGGVASAIAFFSRLNQAISRCFLSAAILAQLAQAKKDSPQLTMARSTTPSIVYTTLGENALAVGVLYFLHLGDQVGELDQSGVSVAPGTDDVDTFGPGAQGFHDLVGVEHFVADDVVDLVEDHQVICAGIDGVAARLPAQLGQLDVFGSGFGAADFHDPPAHGTDFEFVVAQHLGRVQFAVMPGTLDELNHEHPDALADGAKRRAQSAGGFALAGPGVNDQKAFFF